MGVLAVHPAAHHYILRKGEHDMTLRLVASDGVLLVPPESLSPAPTSMTWDARRLVAYLTSGDVHVDAAGYIGIMPEGYAELCGWPMSRARAAYRSLESTGHLILDPSRRDDAPDLWKLRDDLSDEVWARAGRL